MFNEMGMFEAAPQTNILRCPQIQQVLSSVYMHMLVSAEILGNENLTLNLCTNYTRSVCIIPGKGTV